MESVKKIDLILPLEERHSIIAFLTKELAKALEKLGVQVRLLVPPKNKEPTLFLNDLFEHAPDCTICFNGILPDSEGRFLADLIKIPHIAILTESPNGFLELAKSRYTTTLSPDQQYIDILKQAGCERTLFFPMGAPIDIEPVLPLHQRRGSILMAPAWVDAKAIRSMWASNLPKKMLDFLDEVIFRTLSEKPLSYYHAFQLVLSERSEEDQAAFRPWTTFALFAEIEAVVRETDTIELLRALKGMEVDLVVQRGMKESWKNALGDVAENTRFHEGVTMDILKNLIRQTKIFLTSSPQFKYGTTGDLYTALLLGAHVFHNRTEFLEWSFSEDRGVFFYPYLNHQSIRDKATEILAHPTNFEEAIANGRRYVIENETWTNRAELLLEYLPSVLAEIKSSTPA